ncbi:MAG: AraC family transcriptional regulator ligand-binding domain-containing protein [Nevskia sp.]|nr:AraC family transcriptional regulator ligand-binding domain-containing protein [Nevskia sp.]
MPATYGRHLSHELEPDRLWQGTGLTAADLDDMDRHITVRQLLQYAENALCIAKEPGWHFGWAGRLADHFHGPVSVALLSAPTLGEGFDAFLRFFPGRIPYMHMEGRGDGGQYAGILHPLIDLGVCLPLLVETPLVIVQKYFVNVYQVDIAEAAIELSYPPTAYADLYTTHFGCPVHFSRPYNAMVIPERWRRLRNIGHSASTWAHALAQCQQTLVASPERNTLGQVRAHLAAVLERGERERPLPTLAETADALHTSQRTLMRRLRCMGTTYQQLIDELLRARACELLTGGKLKVKQVATALGFDNPANFGKAFKRWSGISPGSYRSRHGAESR